MTWTTLITTIQALRPFILGCILPQTARIILCKTGSDQICLELTASGFVQTDPVRKQAGVPESSGPFLANASEPIRIGCKLDPACLLDNGYKDAGEKIS